MPTSAQSTRPRQASDSDVREHTAPDVEPTGSLRRDSGIKSDDRWWQIEFLLWTILARLARALAPTLARADKKTVDAFQAALEVSTALEDGSPEQVNGFGGIAALADDAWNVLKAHRLPATALDGLSSGGRSDAVYARARRELKGRWSNAHPALRALVELATKRASAAPAKRRQKKKAKSRQPPNKPTPPKHVSKVNSKASASRSRTNPDKQKALSVRAVTKGQATSKPPAEVVKSRPSQALAVGGADIAAVASVPNKGAATIDARARTAHTSTQDAGLMGALEARLDGIGARVDAAETLFARVTRDIISIADDLCALQGPYEAATGVAHGKRNPQKIASFVAWAAARLCRSEAFVRSYMSVSKRLDSATRELLSGRPEIAGSITKMLEITSETDPVKRAEVIGSFEKGEKAAPKLKRKDIEKGLLNGGLADDAPIPLGLAEQHPDLQAYPNVGAFRRVHHEKEAAAKAKRGLGVRISQVRVPFGLDGETVNIGNESMIVRVQALEIPVADIELLLAGAKGDGNALETLIIKEGNMIATIAVGVAP